MPIIARVTPNSSSGYASTHSERKCFVQLIELSCWTQTKGRHVYLVLHWIGYIVAARYENAEAFALGNGFFSCLRRRFVCALHLFTCLKSPILIFGKEHEEYFSTRSRTKINSIVKVWFLRRNFVRISYGRDKVRRESSYQFLFVWIVTWNRKFQLWQKSRHSTSSRFHNNSDC